MAELRRLQGGAANRLPFIPIVIVVLTIMFFASSCYTVDADENAVVTRFGAYERTADSGLHFKLPFGMEQAIRVKVDSVRKQEFGFRTLASEGRSEYSDRDYTSESLMLTGDLNQAEVEWIVQYRVKDAKDFVFNVKDPEETLRALSESAVRAVIGDRSITEALTFGKADVENEARTTLQSALDLYRAGVEILRVNLQSVLPPDPVKPAFNAVNDAEQERETMINEALRDYNQVIPSAKGRAEQVVQSAEGYRIDRVNRAKGEAARFRSILTEYQKAPEVTKRRLYLEVMAQVLPQAARKIVIQDDLKGLIPLLPLDAGKGGGK